MNALTVADADRAIRGGAILSGGGGGSISEGRRLAHEVFLAGAPRLAELEDLAADGLVVTVSLVGAPSATARRLMSQDHVRVVQEMARRVAKPIVGLIASENGGVSTLNGWLASAVLGLPVIDAPADGRAHPTGIMGAMGLDRVADYRTIQVAAAGSILLVAEGSVPATSRLVRVAAVEAGGLVAVCRHPVPPSYLENHAAVGALSLAIELGGLAGVRDVAARLGGEVLRAGTIRSMELATEGGFDRGRVTLNDLSLTFWNEYMTLERAGRRLATFPDLITTVDPETGEAFTSAEATVGRRAEVLVVPRDRIPLGAGVKGYEVSNWSGE